jgi:hypothetical protein
MASIVQNIQVVRSMRKDLRDPKLPINILNSIETIHNCIKSGTDLNGWKKVDWRNGGGNPGRSGGYSSNPQGGNKGGFFGNRQQAPSQSSGRDYGSSSHSSGREYGSSSHSSSHSSGRDYGSTSSHYAFGNRNKSGFTGRQNSEQVSIPLSGSTAAPPAPTSPDTNVIVTPSVPTNVASDGFRFPPQKYVSKFKKSNDNVEDTILNTIILGKLNKFSEQNYPEIKEFITHIIDSGQTDMIKCFMKLVFEKAASEEMFCPLYAKLLSELSIRYPVLLTEMDNLYSQYMEIFDEVNETTAENYNEVCKRNVEKKYRRGYSQFLAELIKHDVIETDLFIKTINKIISQIENNKMTKESIKLTEEFADCLMKIMKAIQTGVEESESDSDSDSESDEHEDKIQKIRGILQSETLIRIQPLTVRNSENIGLSSKARFTMLDIYEGIQRF